MNRDLVKIHDQGNSGTDFYLTQIPVDVSLSFPAVN